LHIKKSAKEYLSPKFGPDIPIFTKFYDFYKELSATIILFPKHKKYTLGQTLDNTTLKIIRFIVSIPQNNNRVALLKKINTELEILKILLRLAKDTKTIPEKKYITLSSDLQEMGRMTGGWIRYLKGF